MPVRLNSSSSRSTSLLLGLLSGALEALKASVGTLVSASVSESFSSSFAGFSSVVRDNEGEEYPKMLPVLPAFSESDRYAASSLEAFLEASVLVLPGSSVPLGSLPPVLTSLICELVSVYCWLASIPSATRSGCTSRMRRHSQLGDFGHILSFLMLMESRSSASTSSLVWRSEAGPLHSWRLSIKEMIACATGEPSSVPWFCTLTTSPQSLR